MKGIDFWPYMSWLFLCDLILFQVIRRVIYKNIGKVFSKKLDIMADII